MTMNCSEAQKHLSAFVDSELSDAMHSRVAIHFEECDSCMANVEAAKSLSSQVRALSDPVPPAKLWNAIEAAMQRESKASPSALAGRPTKWWLRPAAAWVVAASILVLATVGVWASHRLSGGHRHESMAANFDMYLAKFAVDPDQAHETLVAAYDGRPMRPDEAETYFGYRPVAFSGVATGVTVEQMYVLEMPCCRCTLSVCRRPDGGVVTVLEHLEPQPIWFGDRSRIECLCDGKPTSIVQINGKLAASWRHGKRQITVIGANDLEELAQFVNGFNRSTKG